jgi:hypothetical protein
MRAKLQHGYPAGSADFNWIEDPTLHTANALAFLALDQHPEIAELSKALCSSSIFAQIAPTDHELAPMMLTAGGGGRYPFTQIVEGLFISALYELYFLGEPLSDEVYARLVLRGFDELERAVRDERVSAYLMTGFAGISLEATETVSTPWGTLRPARILSGRHAFSLSRPTTTCVLCEQRTLSIKFDRSKTPNHSFPPSDIDTSRMEVLLPLACALSSANTREPISAVKTWSTLLLPFQTSLGISTNPFGVFPRGGTRDLSDLISRLADWCRIVEDAHVPAVDTAAQRIVSAVVHRSDFADALIDAVIAWENLVGTSNEVTFRVTGALAKAIENDSSKRRAVRKELANIYNVRSGIVHGNAKSRASISEAATSAIDVAIRTCRNFYKRGPGWLSMTSSERADVLLLEEP